MKRTNKIIVIGGGASGMAAAYAASLHGASVTILEKNEKLGKKVYISGKGRCNLTNAADTETMRNAVVSNPRFPYSAFSAFSNTDVTRLMEENGCPVKTERGNRVFPVSDHASDVIAAFQRILKKNGVKIRFGCEVKGLLLENGAVTGVRVVSDKKSEEIRADAVILATGGLSYPSTGSTGDGHRMAEETGHTVTALRPALVPLETREDFVSSLSGLSLKNVTLRIEHPEGSRKKKNSPVFEEFGELLFTHFGISGPIALSASSYAGAALEKEGPLPAYIDLKPALDPEKLDRRLLRDFEEASNKDLKNVLPGLVPSALSEPVLKAAGLDGGKKVRDVTKEERRRLAEALKRFPLTVTGTRGFQEAIVTQGGVSVRDVGPGTMESKRIENLYFAGELLDIDALTGGFNLQLAWSTGYLAGRSAAEKGADMAFDIAIDGPSGAGKSTIAKRVAQDMRFLYVDTGAMYRAIGLYYLEHGISLDDPEAMEQALPEITVTTGYEDDVQQIYLNGENVSGRIRTQEVSDAASKASAFQPVRDKLLELQRSLARENDVVMDGRDIGTTILPDAELKIYLTAKTEVRAKRRYDELVAKGAETDFATVLKEIEERDYRDTHRESSPLRKAEDAVEVDSSDLGIDEVAAMIEDLIRKRAEHAG